MSTEITSNVLYFLHVCTIISLFISLNLKYFICSGNFFFITLDLIFSHNLFKMFCKGVVYFIITSIAFYSPIIRIHINWWVLLLRFRKIIRCIWNNEYEDIKIRGILFIRAIWYWGNTHVESDLSLFFFLFRFTKAGFSGYVYLSEKLCNSYQFKTVWFNYCEWFFRYAHWRLYLKTR